MIFDMNDHRTLGEIREAFSRRFPFLAIEFPNRPVKGKKIAPHKHLHPPDTTVGGISMAGHPGFLEIYPRLKVKDVEEVFKKDFGITVQVLRNMHGAWVLTSDRDHLTLDEENEIAARSQAVIHPDYDERVEEREY